MLNMHPYGMSNPRIVSDRSRFEYDDVVPRNRSRNTTPTELDHESEMTSFDSILHPAKKPTLLEVAERNNQPANEDHENDFFNDYLEESLLDDRGYDDDKHSEFMPYPTSRSQLRAPVDPRYNRPNADSSSPIPPPKDKPRAHFLPQPTQKNAPHGASTAVPPQSAYVSQVPQHYTPPTGPMPSQIHQPAQQIPQQQFPPQPTPAQQYPPQEQPIDGDLPKLMTPADAQAREEMEVDTATIDLKKQTFEEKLIRAVMNREFAVIPTKKPTGFNTYEETKFLVSFNFFLYLFEIVVAIIVISLAAVLAQRDHQGTTAVYQFIIADGSICLFILVLFLFQIVNFEKRNGSFYCILATVMNFISFIMVLSSIISNSSCDSNDVCLIRKALTAFVVISFLIWVCNLTMFATTVYISRLNLLKDLNFDYSEKGLSQEYNLVGTPVQGRSSYQHSVQHGESFIPFEGNPPVYRQTSTVYRAPSEVPPTPNPQGYVTAYAKNPPVIVTNDGTVVDPNSGQRVKEFTLNQNGELLEIADNFGVQKNKKIIVYPIAD